MNTETQPSATALLERIAKRPLIFDGAMGTMIYEHGVFVNACYDELNLTRADLIHEIHRAYVDAGVDVIETNTFGANRIKLAAFGLADRVTEINQAAVRIAREAASGRALISGSVGPCLLPEQESGDLSDAEIEAALHEQLLALREAGVDLIMLETFCHPNHLKHAASIAKQLGHTVLASFTLHRLRSGTEEIPPGAMAARLDANPDVDIIGINCAVGPAGMMEPLRQVLAASSKPVVAMPNAGGPSEVGGRLLYFNTPEYFTEYAKKYIELGARGVGGCCGTTPDDLRAAVRAISGMSGVRKHIEITTSDSIQQVDAPRLIPTAEKSPFGKKISSGEKVTSVEMLPPRSGDGMPRFLDHARWCHDAGVDAINIPDGPRACARVSVFYAAIELQAKTEIEAIPHYCCRDRNLIGMQADMLGGTAAGLKNWLLITGDPPKLGDYPDATGVFDLDAIGLCRLCDNLNHGLDAAGKQIGSPAGMLLGVGANPVAVEMEREISRFFGKVEAGAEYAITQPVFDTDALFRFLERIAKHERQIPIIAGIYPLVSLRNAQFMNDHVPGVVVPDWILERMAQCSTREEGLQMGIEIARELRQKIEPSVAGIQVSAPLGKTRAALDVLA